MRGSALRDYLDEGASELGGVNTMGVMTSLTANRVADHTRLIGQVCRPTASCGWSDRYADQDRYADHILSNARNRSRTISENCHVLHINSPAIPQFNYNGTY